MVAAQQPRRRRFTLAAESSRMRGNQTSVSGERMKQLSRHWLSVRGLCASLVVLLCAATSSLADTNNTANGAADAAPARITTPSGLQYEDIKVGTGVAARVGAKVTVHYTGWLRNRDGSVGKKFDSSLDSGEPFQFIVGQGQVIPGWDEGLQGMKVGGIRKLYIPAALGYGARGAGREIPANAKLLFEVELLSL
jgi:FKBP-type peptidyl-prolyl cis-trans isomerase FkpA